MNRIIYLFLLFLSLACSPYTQVQQGKQKAETVFDSTGSHRPDWTPSPAPATKAPNLSAIRSKSGFPLAQGIGLTLLLILAYPLFFVKPENQRQ